MEQTKKEFTFILDIYILCLHGLLSKSLPSNLTLSLINIPISYENKVPKIFTEENTPELREEFDRKTSS